MTAHDQASASTARVLVLTPVKNAAKRLLRYCELVERLDWSAERLSIGILEGDSQDGSWELLQSMRDRLKARCDRLTLVQRHFGFQFPPGVPRWAPAYQLVRRGILARARNNLLMRALDDEDWVLWVDVDVIDYPADILRQLLAHSLDIVHPHCVKQPGGPTFDLNAWAERGRRGMSELRGHGPVRLDAVGGTMLLVRADLHRDGLVFPPFRYGLPSSHIREQHPVWGQGEVETEGFGAMAADMNVQCWGLPDLEIVHADD